MLYSGHIRTNLIIFLIDVESQYVRRHSRNKKNIFSYPIPFEVLNKLVQAVRSLRMRWCSWMTWPTIMDCGLVHGSPEFLSICCFSWFRSRRLFLRIKKWINNCLWVMWCMIEPTGWRTQTVVVLSVIVTRATLQGAIFKANKMKLRWRFCWRYYFEKLLLEIMKYKYNVKTIHESSPNSLRSF